MREIGVFANNYHNLRNILEEKRSLYFAIGAVTAPTEIPNVR